MKVAVLGIGLMGYRMTQRLLEAGHEVHVWNRTHERALPLADLGATVHASAPQAAAAAECVITMLENGPVVGEVLFVLGTAPAMAASAAVLKLKEQDADRN